MFADKFNETGRSHSMEGKKQSEHIDKSWWYGKFDYALNSTGF